MANYVAIEQKVKQDETYEVSTYKKASKEEAERAYHSILTVAATSDNLIHSASILNPEGQLIKTECYKHDKKPEPEPEPEPTPDPEPENNGGEE